MGQLLRWSWGYHVLLASKDKCALSEQETAESRVERGAWRYSDNPEDDERDRSEETLVGVSPGGDVVTPNPPGSAAESVHGESPFDSGGHTPVSSRPHSYSKLPIMSDGSYVKLPSNGVIEFPVISNGHLTTFAGIAGTREPETPKGLLARCRHSIVSFFRRLDCFLQTTFGRLFEALPNPAQKASRALYTGVGRFFNGLWGFMNPPLWAMLVAVVVASVPPLQRLFFDEGSFVTNSVTRAVQQSGNVAVPLILVVLGANLARNTLPKDAIDDIEDPTEEKRLIIASLISRLVFPALIMAPLLALTAKYVSVSILSDPIFVVVCFLLMGAPSALQLAQICQINNVFMGAMSSVLFQSYVVWYDNPSFLFFLCTDSIYERRILPSTLVLVMCALQVVQWATT